MKKIIFATAIALLTTMPASAQYNNNSTAKPVQNISVELLGPSNWLGLHYDTRVKGNSGWGYSVGLGWGYSEASTLFKIVERYHLISLVPRANYLIGNKSSKLELGFGTNIGYLTGKTEYDRYNIKEKDMNILLIEDNKVMSKSLKYSLETNNYKVIALETIKASKEHLKTKPEIDLVILDINLPDGTGYDLYEQTIKKIQIPTIFLTARDDENDIVKGLTIGAEDYLTKPFSTKELLARINKILLRAQKNTVIKVGDISFDIDKMIVLKGENQINLTSLEIKLLALLFNNINKVVNRNTILDKVWEWTGNDVDDHTITVYFQRIRNKLGSNIITTVKGIGYRIDEQ